MMKMNKKRIKSKKLDELFQAILQLKNVEECYRFFSDLATIQEIQDFADRLEVAKLLREKMSYVMIEQKTKMSSATISRVAKSLAYGEGGYELILKRLATEE
jgi:TrpR-related protein YerC/YecD